MEIKIKTVLNYIKIFFQSLTLQDIKSFFYKLIFPSKGKLVILAGIDLTGIHLMEVILNSIFNYFDIPIQYTDNPIFGVILIALGLLYEGYIYYIDGRFKNNNLNIMLPSSKNKTKSLSALKYQSEIVGFIGRKSELSQLKEFNDSHDLFKWWIIGGTGGSGKSRLALELCNIYKVKGWHCGFVNFNDTLDFNNWHPTKPHLIICDYVLNNEDYIATLIKNSIQVNETHKIRILLLERDAETVIKSLNSSPIFGSSIENSLHNERALILSDFDENDLENMLNEIAKFFKLPNFKLPNLNDFINDNNPSRAFLMGSLFCLYHYNQTLNDTPVDFKDIIRELIEREKNQWGLDKAQLDYLLLATMVDGIDLNNIGLLSDTVIEFLKAYKPRKYKKAVSQSSKNYLSPLSHDLISELYVLDDLEPPNNLTNEPFKSMLQLALGIDNGKELVSFFTRAANDYPNHPTLKELLKRFSNVEPHFTIWLLIVTNIIDKIDVSLDEKLDTFHRIYKGLSDLPEVFPRFSTILDSLFIRLLTHITNLDELKQWVVEYKVIEPKKEELFIPPIQNITIAKNLQLKPLNYCESILYAFSQLTEAQKLKMSSFSFFEVTYHYILHKLHSREANLNDIDSILKESKNILGKELTPALCLMFRDTMAGFVQWGYLQKKEHKEKILEMTYWMLNDIESRNKLSNELATCYSIAIQIVSETIRTFDARKNIMERFSDTFTDNIESSDYVASKFIGASIVIMSSPFNCSGEYMYGKDLIIRLKQLLDKYPTEENIESYIFALMNLFNNNGPYTIAGDKEEILDNCINSVKMYGSVSNNILDRVISTISTQYNKEIQDDLSEDNRLLDKAIDLITYFEDSYTSDIKVQMGGFYDKKFQRLLESEDYESLKKIIDSMAYVSKIHFVELHYQMWTNINNELFRRWNISNREQNIKTSKYLQDIAKYCLDNLPNESKYMHIMEHIIND